MQAPIFSTIATYASKADASAAALEQGLTPWEAVFHCENGQFGYEIRIYDNWQEWQPDLYTNGSK